VEAFFAVRFTCANCLKVFERTEGCMMYFRDDAIYLFCSKECRDKWIYLVIPEKESPPEEIMLT
jgi:ribosomal protein L24E